MNAPIAQVISDHCSVDEFVRHRGPVTSVAGIPGKQAAISCAYDSAVAWVDLDKGTMQLMGYHDHLVNAVTVDSKGKRAASSSSDYSVCLWDLSSRRPEKLLRGHFDDVNGFSFCEENRGASVSHDYRVYCWDLKTGEVDRVLQGHEKYAMSVDYADGRIYTSGDDMTLRQWDSTSGELLHTWGPFEVETDSCAIDAGRHRVVLGADDGCLRIFDSETGETVTVIEAHGSGIKKVAISPVNGDILSAAYDQRILVWDANSYELKYELADCQGTWERSISWMPDGQKILAGTFDGTVRVWDAEGGCLLQEIGKQEETPGNLCFNDVAADDQGNLILVSDDGYVRRAYLSADRAELVQALEPETGRVLMNGVAMDAGSGVFAAGAHDQKLHLFKPADHGQYREIETDLQEGPINTISISKQPGFEQHVFVGCYNGTVVHVSESGEILKRLAFHENAIKGLAIHAEKPFGASCSADGAVITWNFKGEQLQNIPAHIAIADDLDMSPNGEQVVTVSRDFTAKVFDTQTGVLKHNFSLGQKSPKSTCFFDDETIFVGNYWGSLIRFDLRTGRKYQLDIASNGLSAMCRSGKYLVITSYDGGVFLVDPVSFMVKNSLQVMQQRVVAETVSGLL